MIPPPLDVLGQVNSDVAALLSRLEAHQSLAASQHAMLASHHNSFLNDRFLAAAEDRALRLDKLFQNFDTTFHVNVTEYALFLSGLPQRNKELALVSLREQPNTLWCDLVHRVADTVQNAEIIIWNCEEISRVALPWLAKMLDMEPKEFNDQDREIIRELIVNEPRLHPHEHDDEILELFDSLLENDLFELGRLPSVKLVRPADVPESLWI
jgi:hypothetical protein